MYGDKLRQIPVNEIYSKLAMNIPSIIRQNGESQNVLRKQRTPNFPQNEQFLPRDTHTYVCVSGGKKCLFFWKIWRALFY